MIYTEHAVPVLLSILDFIFGAILFNAGHSIFLIIFLFLYYTMNFLVSHFSGHVIYTSIQLDWTDWKSLLKVAIHFILTMLIYYILYIITRCRHAGLMKRVSKRRLTIKQELFKDNQFLFKQQKEEEEGALGDQIRGTVSTHNGNGNAIS